MSGKNILHGFTSLQRDLCYHIMHDGGGYKSTINTTYNIYTGGSIWGCGGNIWQGIAFGAGYGIINSLFSFLNTGSSPFVSSWGGGGVSSRSSEGTGSNKKAKKAREKIVEKECKDIDRKKLLELEDKVYNLEHPEKSKITVTRDSILKLKSELEQAKKDTDKHHTETDKSEYDKKIRRLEILLEKYPEVKAAEKEQNNNNNVNQTQSVTLQFAEHDGIDDPKIEGQIESLKLEKGEVKEYVINCGQDLENGHKNKYKLRYLVTYNGVDENNKKQYKIKLLSTTHNLTDGNGKPIQLYYKENGLVYTMNAQCKLENNSADTIITKTIKGKTGYKLVPYNKTPETPKQPEGHVSANGFDLKCDNCGNIEATKKEEEKT